MKTVFKSSHDVIHVFAQRTQNEGRCSNVYFYGDNIYSYGSHYLLGEFMENYEGKRCIWINDDGYSNTTRNHISELRDATSHYQQFIKSETNIFRVHSRLEDISKLLPRARQKKESYRREAENLWKSYCLYNEWFPITLSDALLSLTHENIISLLGVIRGSISADDHSLGAMERQRVAHKKAADAKIEANKKRLSDFNTYKVTKTGKINGEDFLRISKDKGFVETTQGIRIPVRNAAILYKAIVSGVDIKGMTIKGEHSDYTVQSINGVLTIGCHTINIKSVHKTGKKIL